MLACDSVTVNLYKLAAAALDCFDTTARREDLALKMNFEPGDVQLLNNFITVHGRSAYEDHPEPERRRFLYRLWLNLGDTGPWNTESETMRQAFARFGNLGLTASQWRATQPVGATTQSAR